MSSPFFFLSLGERRSRCLVFFFFFSRLLSFAMTFLCVASCHYPSFRPLFLFFFFSMHQYRLFFLPIATQLFPQHVADWKSLMMINQLRRVKSDPDHDVIEVSYWKNTTAVFAPLCARLFWLCLTDCCCRCCLCWCWRTVRCTRLPFAFCITS